MGGGKNMSERPHSRKRHDSGKTTQAQKHESLGSGRQSNSGFRSSAVTRGGGISLAAILVAAFMLFGGNGSQSTDNTSQNTAPPNNTPAVTPSQSSSSNTFHFGTPTTNNVTYNNASSNAVNTSVSSGARDKYTTILGNGQDQVTVLVYMCGTDLESNYGMATADINEMALASHSDKVNIVIESGGTKRWKNNVLTAGTNQLWLVQDRALYPLNRDLGRRAMTDSDNLAEFIRYGVQNFPANRYMLIFWDHGGGSLTGYGYDELYPNSSMTVDKIASALEKGGTKFDIIGFDACLMANMETALAIEPYADYLLASEETEPGTGWYYTEWVTQLSQNSSLSSLDIGKKIIDDFCTKKQSGSSSADKNTLSIVDLAEFRNTVPSALSSFAKSVSTAVSNNYQGVSNARSATREFGQAQRLDQIDLVHFCDTMNTSESKKLAEALRGCVKYNRTRNVSNAYGLSIYFPYRNTRQVSTALKIYDNIGFDRDYAAAMKSFANLQASGQSVNYGTSNSLFDLLGGSAVSNGTSYNSLDLSSLLGYGSQSSSSGYDLSSLLGGSNAVDSSAYDLISALLGRAHIDNENLTYTDKNGQKVLSLSEDDWAMVQDVKLNVWADDGGGYIDLGQDNIFEFDADNDLIADYDGMWLAVNDQLISYRMLYTDKADDGTWLTVGYAPILLNGEKARLIIEFSGEEEYGHVVGAEMVYDEVNTDGKLIPYIDDGNALNDEETACLKAGDEIRFTCDYYTYEGEYEDTYILSDPVYVGEGMTVEDVTITGQDMIFGYVLQDIYGSERRTPMLPYSE